MDIQTIKVGILQTNCYILSINDQIILIDPGAKAERILNAIGQRKVLAILLTHAHFDHIGALNELLTHFTCPVYLHQDDEPLLRNPELNYSFPKRFVVDAKPIYYPRSLNIGEFKFEIIETPGHTEGSVCLIIENNMFSGDTLFMQSVGRTDLKTGNPSQMKQSLRKLKALDQNYVIYPGHDDTTTLDQEKKYNIYLK